jgi:predicted aspartyl protease
MMPLPEAGTARVDLRATPAVVAMARFEHRPVIMVHVNGAGPYPFLLDTGAAGTTITDSLARDLDLESVGRARVGDPTQPGGVETRVVAIDSITAGDVAVRGVRATVLPPDGFPLRPGMPRGVLSLRDLPRLLVTFDFPASKIALEPGDLPAPNGNDVLPCEAPEGTPEIRVVIAGTPIRAHLDTGSSGELMVPKELATRLPLGRALREVGTARTVRGEFVLYAAPLKGEVWIGGFMFKNPELRFSDNLPVANVGAGLLADLILTVDRTNKRIRLARPQTR